MIKILVADDHPVVRQGIRMIFEDTPDVVVADEASNGQEVIEKLFQSDFDVVLLDIAFPGRSGLDILKQLKSIKPNLPVLIFSIYPEERFGIRSLRAGASGYLSKAKSPSELIKAIRKVAKGRKYITSSLAERLTFELDEDREKPVHGRLTDREYQVMCMIASGMSIKEIAKSLSLSEKTISTHRAHILKKMRMKNNYQLTHYAIKNGLVD